MQKILPPILFILFVMLAAVVSWNYETLQNLNYPYNLSGIILIVIGLALASHGSNLFKLRSANIMTFDKPTRLVIEGVYQYSRNPMYLGFVIALAGFVILTGANWAAIMLLLIFIIITNSWYIAFEEKAMKQEFGDEYIDYCTRVRRWI